MYARVRGREKERERERKRERERQRERDLCNYIWAGDHRNTVDAAHNECLAKHLGGSASTLVVQDLRARVPHPSLHDGHCLKNASLNLYSCQRNSVSSVRAFRQLYVDATGLHPFMFVRVDENNARTPTSQHWVVVLPSMSMCCRISVGSSLLIFDSAPTGILRSETSCNGNVEPRVDLAGGCVCESMTHLSHVYIEACATGWRHT